MSQNALKVVGDYLASRKDRIGKILPASCGVTPQKLISVTLMAMSENPQLLKCSPESVYKSLLDSSRMGLEIGGPMALAYLVPYRDKAQLIIGYRGLIELARRAGSIQDADVFYVHEGDTFRREMGIGGKWTHIASLDQDRETKPITHVYAEFLLASGHSKRFVMTRDEINRHRDKYSQAARSSDSPWQTNWKAMAAKTVLKQPILRGLIGITVADGQGREVDIKQHLASEDYVQSNGDMLVIPPLSPTPRIEEVHPHLEEPRQLEPSPTIISGAPSESSEEPEAPKKRRGRPPKKKPVVKVEETVVDETEAEPVVKSSSTINFDEFAECLAEAKDIDGVRRVGQIFLNAAENDSDRFDIQIELDARLAEFGEAQEK